MLGMGLFPEFSAGTFPPKAWRLSEKLARVTPKKCPLSGAEPERKSIHAEAIAHEYGSGTQAYCLFEPPGPAPQEAPLIVFNHGRGGAMDPRVYLAWIDPIVGRGNIADLGHNGVFTP